MINLSLNAWLLTVLGGFVGYAIYGLVWRLYFSPIAHFPGPRIAAATLLYELYYEMVAGGQYTFRIRDMHEEYGPIIRINPWELHINDPEYYEEVYAGSSRRTEKWPYTVGLFGNPESTIATVPHELHRRRRMPMNRLFSKTSIAKLEPLIQSTVDKLVARLRTFQQSSEVVPMHLAWACATADIISTYAFGQNSNYVETAPAFRCGLYETIRSTTKAAQAMKQISWILPLVKMIPLGVVKLLDRNIFSILVFQNQMRAYIQTIVDESSDARKSDSYRTIFHEILASDMPASETRVDRLTQEGVILLGAGMETTAWALSVITYHVLANPAIHAKLQAELDGAFLRSGGKPSLSQLEQLPYLSAVISEGLRLSYGVSQHLPRVSPDQDLLYGAWRIPAGTPVSMTSVLLHLNPTTFPAPTTFDPERFVADPHLSRYLVNFTKGSRVCIGINLAYAELFLCVANVFGLFPGMKLVDTTIDDVEIKADLVVPQSSGRGVRVAMA